MLLKLTRVVEYTDDDGVVETFEVPVLLNPMHITDAKSLHPKIDAKLWANEMRAGARTLFIFRPDGLQNIDNPEDIAIVVKDDITDVAIRCGAV